jgi:two-component system phosphate regulon sensor histidine kinase PhoR
LVRPSTARICITLACALCALVAATYWLTLQHPPQTSWLLLRGGLIITGAVTLLALGFHALQRDWARDRAELLAFVRQGVLGEEAEAPGAPPDARAAVAPLREHIATLRRRVQEITLQRKELEIQLRLAEAEQRQTQTLINGISDAVLVTNEFDELLLANPAAASLFGFALPEAVRRPVAGLLADTRLLHDIAELRQNYARSGRRVLDLTFDAPPPLGPRSFTASLAPVTDPAGGFTGVVCVLHETTRERQVARMKSDFVSHVSHELRTPLSSIKAYAELLVDGEAGDDKTRQEFYQVIQNEANRLSRLIDNILNISRIESGMIRVTKAPVGLSAILKQVLEVAMPSAREKNIALVDQVQPGFFQVQVDRDMIYQAALNLVSNAIKYTPAGGTVRLETRLDPADARVSVFVHDTGVGIDPEAMEHLFEKFYRVEAHKNLAKGSGLGLHLTRQIIETVHDGRMLVESTPGAGSTFGFTLPILQ